MEAHEGHAAGGGDSDACVVHLFEGPYVMCGGERRTVPQGSRRLLAFVALGRGRVERPYAAGALWPFGDDRRAAGNLRSALWRMRQAGIDVIVADKWSLTLAAHVLVDVQLLAEWANRVIQGTPQREDISLAHLPADALGLLPGWHDDWAIIERERIRQRLLHAMEAMSRYLTGERRFDAAVAVARRAIAEEPLRESAQRVLLEAQLAQGHRAEAAESFEAFKVLTRASLGVEPSDELTAMVGGAKADFFTVRSRLPGVTAASGPTAPLAASQ